MTEVQASTCFRWKQRIVCAGFIFLQWGEWMLLEQERAADETREFLSQSGLKAKFVAEQIRIDRQSLSKFMNHRLALSQNQLFALQNFMNDYRQRNNL